MASASTEDENVYLISDEEDPEEDLFMMTEFEAENYKKLRASKGAPEAPKVAALTDYDLNVVAEDETTATETHKNSKLTLGKSCWFKCSKCPYRTLDRLRLRQHSVDKHSKTRGRKPLFKCIDCDFKTETPALLRFHKDKSCPKRNKETLDFKITDLDLDGKDEEKSQPTPETLSEWFKCPHCPCRLQGEDLKKDHLQNFHAEKWRSCSSCSFETYETEKLEEHVRVEHNVSLNCEQCDFMTTSQQLLSHHLFHKHSVVKWSCTHCDHPAATKLDLDLHVDQKHSNWIQCSQCSVKVPTDDAMADHVLTHPVYVYKSPEDDDEVKEKDIAQKDSTGGSSTEDSAPTIVVEQRSFCTFCKKSMESLLLHLVTMHKDEEEVKKILLLRKGSVKNKPLAADKSQEATENRGKGKSNKGKVGRQPQKNNSGKLSCPICKKSFSKLSLRQHYVKCNKSAAEETKSKLVLNKRVTAALYSNALPTLRDKIFPACRDDAKGIVIKTDELLIQYGNDLVKTFKNLHQHGKIREKLRAVANFFNKVRGLDKKINSFRKIFHPKHLQNAVTALNICGSFNVTTGKYDAPSNVQTLGTYVKQIGAIALREYKNNPNKTQEVESFLQLWQKQLEVIAPHVPQTKKKKKMNSKICDVTDVKLLWNYLYKNRMDCYQKLRRQFSCDVWRQLAEYTLTSIIVFCKLGRIGELERLPVSDLGWDDPTHPERLVIRNSLPQTVPVLQDRDILNCIGSVVSNRAAAGVDPKNPYAFGIPSRALEHRHLIASVLLPNYAEECGAAKPEVLRSTQLRQHFITFLSKKNIKEWELCDLANFLKRAGKISKRHLSTKFRKKPQDKKLTSTPLVALETLTLVTSDGTLKPVTSDSILPLVTSDSTLPLVTSDSTLPLVASDSTLRPIGRAGVLRAREEQPVRRKFREYSAIAPAIKSPKTAQAKSRVDRNNRSTKSKIQRTTWQPSENLAIRRAFKYYFRTFKLPTLEECEKSRQLNRALEGRTAIMIKAHVNNEINRMKRGNDRKT